MLHGMYINIELPFLDKRGHFRNIFSNNFLNLLNTNQLYFSESLNVLAGTVRGMHRQSSPHDESKIVSVTHGKIVDVTLDARPNSPTYGESFALEISEENGVALFIPSGVLHGFQTLLPSTRVIYALDGSYSPEHIDSYSIKSPAIRNLWPLPFSIISDEDEHLPLWL
jgi:dTDP-4-dehydrorhamnose 3,5-epimerase